MKRVFAWQTDTAGCFLYRLKWPLEALPPDQFQVAWGAPGEDVFDNDVVIWQRGAEPSELWEQLCRDSSVLAVYDIDDDLMNVDPVMGIIHDIYAPKEGTIRRNIEMADVVTVSTPKLAEYLFQFNRNVVVLPNCLPRSWQRNPVADARPPIVGWAGSMFHGWDFDGIPAQLEQLQANVDVRFETWGANYFGRMQVATYGWTTMESYHPNMTFTIGIAPLKHSVFNDRKSHCKLLEYGARGVPAVASNWGQYSEWITDGVNGFLVNDHTQWADALMALCDHETRRVMSLGAVAKAAEYTIENQISRWATVYNRGEVA